MNLTNGRLSDEVVRRWVAADLRRGKGDGWAFLHLRLDIVNAGVLGPRGLNGTDLGISAERAKGAVELTSQSGELVAAGVVAISPEIQELADLTEFVIVLTHRATGRSGERLLADGRREVVPSRRLAGELSWQLDTGEFREDPVVGELWYQAHGWSCGIDRPGTLDEICRLVRPREQQIQTPPSVHF